MSLRIKALIFITLIVGVELLRGQTSDEQQLFENVIEQNESSADFNTLLEDIEYYRLHPIPINKADYSMLVESGLFNSYQAFQIVAYREKFGFLRSPYELAYINGFSEEDIIRIADLLTFSTDFSELYYKPFKQKTSHELFLRYGSVLEEKRGFKEGMYSGDAGNYYLRYKLTSRNVSAGITLDKDPGESFWDSRPDFYSAHISVKDISILKSIVVGDYTLKVGQGLALWTGFRNSKSSLTTSIDRQAELSRGYTSVNENQFFRGGVTSIELKNLTVTPFYSSQQVDANITNYDSLGNKALGVSSLQESGLHRTEGELWDKDALRQSVFGADISYQKRYFKIGLTGFRTILSSHFEPTSDFRNLHNFRGSQLDNFSLHFKHIHRFYNVFGEYAINHLGGYALIQGVNFSLENIRLTFSYRKYSKDYFSFFSNAFSEQSDVNNETGFYIGLEGNVNSKISYVAYTDFYTHPWLKFNASFPSSGTDYLFQLNYKTSKTGQFYLRLRHEIKQVNHEKDLELPFLIDQKRSSVRLNWAIDLSPNVSLQSRYEQSLFSIDDQSEQGYLLFQDIKYKLNKTPATFILRTVIFDTDGFGSRIYAYENDILYYFSVPSFQGSGLRYVLNVHYEVSSQIDFWVKLSQTRYADRNSVGTGWEEIDKNHRTEIRAQMRLKF